MPRRHHGGHGHPRHRGGAIRHGGPMGPMRGPNAMHGASPMMAGPRPLVDEDEADYAPDGNDFPVFAGQTIENRYEIKKVLGAGTFGKVVECKDRMSGKMVAVKISKMSSECREEFQNEIRMLESVRQRDPSGKYHYAHLIEAIPVGQQIAMVFPRYGMSLYSYMKRTNFRPFKIQQIRCIAKQLMATLGFFHECGIIHTDIKPENILFVDNSYDLGQKGMPPKQLPDNPKIVLIDFGSSTFTHARKEPEVGTADYQSPEVALHLDWGTPIDSWGVAVVLLELYLGRNVLRSGRDPMEQLSHFQKYLGPIPSRMARRGRAPMMPGMAPALKSLIRPQDADFYNLLKMCLQLDPAQRMTCSAALNHPFLTAAGTTSSSSSSSSSAAAVAAASKSSGSVSTEATVVSASSSATAPSLPETAAYHNKKMNVANAVPTVQPAAPVLTAAANKVKQHQQQQNNTSKQSQKSSSAPAPAPAAAATGATTTKTSKDTNNKPIAATKPGRIISSTVVTAPTPVKGARRGEVIKPRGDKENIHRHAHHLAGATTTTTTTTTTTSNGVTHKTPSSPGRVITATPKKIIGSSTLKGSSPMRHGGNVIKSGGSSSPSFGQAKVIGSTTTTSGGKIIGSSASSGAKIMGASPLKNTNFTTASPHKVMGGSTGGIQTKSFAINNTKTPGKGGRVVSSSGNALPRGARIIS